MCQVSAASLSTLSAAQNPLGLTDADVQSYRWDFGDGTPNGSGAWANHDYYATVPTYYTVGLTATFYRVKPSHSTQTFQFIPTDLFAQWAIDDTGGLRIAFKGPLPAGANNVCNSASVTCYYQWEFGDPQQSVAGGTYPAGTFPVFVYPNPGRYSATLTLTATDSNNNQKSKSVTQVIEVHNNPPVAGFNVSCTGLACSFDAVGDPQHPLSIDEQLVASYDWDFGDGTVLSGSVSGTSQTKPSHTYANTSTRQAKLRVRDPQGLIGDLTKALPLPDYAPVPRFNFACSGDVCSFDGSPSTDDVGLTGYSWMFHDASTGTPQGATVQHTFPQTPVSGTYAVDLTVTDTAGHSTTSTQKVSVNGGALPRPEHFVAVAPCRFLDTRNSSDGPSLSSGVPRDLVIAGGALCGIPADAKAVALNATAVPIGSAAGYLEMFATGTPTPPTAVLNFDSNVAPVANNAYVAVGTGGAIRAVAGILGGGATDLIVDVSGYFTESPGLSFQAFAACREYDSRTLNDPLLAGVPRMFTLDGTCGVPWNAAAGFLNLAVVNAPSDGHIWAISSDYSSNTTSSINFRPSQLSRANGITTGYSLSRPDQIRMTLSTAANATFVIDTLGYFSSDAPLSYYPLTPCRLADTRDVQRGIPRLMSGVRQDFQAQGNCGVPFGAAAVVVNLTETNNDAAGHLIAYASDQAPPGGTVMNFPPGLTTIGNQVVIPLSRNSRDFSLQSYVVSGGVDVIADVVGFFASPASISTSSIPPVTAENTEGARQ